MGTELLPQFAKPLELLVPKMANVLPVAVPPEVINRTILHAIEGNSYLAKADVNSVMGCAMTAAVLGLQCDGHTGQAYIVPFGGRQGVRAQFLPGYKGQVTLADRARRVIRAGVVLDGDTFEFDEPRGWVRHVRVLGRESERDVVAAWAIAEGKDAPQVAVVLSRDQILARRDASSGWKSYQEGKIKSNPWATHFQPQCRKSAVHALAPFVPVLPLQLATALDTQHDLGHHAMINEDRNVVIDGEVVTREQASPKPAEDEPPRRPADPLKPFYVVVMPDGEERDKKNVDEWLDFFGRVWDRAEKSDQPGLRLTIARANMARALEIAEKHHHLSGPSRIADALLSVIEQVEGA